MKNNTPTLVTFTQFEDHVHFEYAVKNLNWRRAMDVEMKALQREMKLGMTTLSGGAKKMDLNGYLIPNIMRKEMLKSTRHGQWQNNTPKYV